MFQFCPLVEEGEFNLECGKPDCGHCEYHGLEPPLTVSLTILSEHDLGNWVVISILKLQFITTYDKLHIDASNLKMKRCRKKRN